MRQRTLPALCERVLGGLWSDTGITVVVAPDPGAKLHKPRQRDRLWLRFVDVLERLVDLLVQFRNRFEQHGAVIESHLDLVEHRRSSATNFIALPPGRDLRRHFLLDLESA